MVQISTGLYTIEDAELAMGLAKDRVAITTGDFIFPDIPDKTFRGLEINQHMHWPFCMILVQEEDYQYLDRIHQGTTDHGRQITKRSDSSRQGCAVMVDDPTDNFIVKMEEEDGKLIANINYKQIMEIVENVRQSKYGFQLVRPR